MVVEQHIPILKERSSLNTEEPFPNRERRDGAASPANITNEMTNSEAYNTNQPVMQALVYNNERTVAATSDYMTKNPPDDYERNNLASEVSGEVSITRVAP